MKVRLAVCVLFLFVFADYNYGFASPADLASYNTMLAQVPGGRTERKAGSEAVKKTGPDVHASVSNTAEPQREDSANLSGTSLIDTIVGVNSKFAYVTIALAAIICVFMLLLLVRMGGIRNSIGKIERDIMHTKEALRYIMELSQQSGLGDTSSKPNNSSEGRSERGQDAALVRISAELEKLSRKVDSFPRPATSAGKQLFSDEEVSREVQRRLETMRIETIEPGPGDVFDAVLHEEVDVKLCRTEQDGTIFRVIQNGLIYNNRVALKARVVVNRI